MPKNDADDQTTDISNLQQNFSKQQKKISALKELVRKSEVAHGKSTSSAQEKVKNIAQRLTSLKSLARSRQSLDVSHQDTSTTSMTLEDASLTEHLVQPSLAPQQLQQLQPQPVATSSRQLTPNPPPLNPHQHDELSTLTKMPNTSFVTTPGSEKVQLLRQQMEENKLRMAMRASSKQHLEQLVTQLKEKFDTTQQCLENTTELGKSMGDLSAVAFTPLSRERHKSVADLSIQPFNLEKERIKFLENRCRLLEKQLEKEKQAKTNRETSLNESAVSQATAKRVKELENKILELEELLVERNVETEKVDSSLHIENESLKCKLLAKEALINELEIKSHGSTDLSAFEAEELGVENERLNREISEKLVHIKDLEEINGMLEATRCNLTIKNNEYEEKLQELKENLRTTETNLTDALQSLEETERKCEELQKTLEKLQNTTEAVIVEKSTDTDTQVKAEMAKQIQEFQEELLQLREENIQLKQQLADSEKLEISDVAIADKITALEATIESQREDLHSRLEECNRYEEELMEKTIELNVLNANFKVLEEKLQATKKNKPLFSSTAEESSQDLELLAEIQQLKQKLDESNKSMIKLKLKYKQTEKQMEKLRKTTDLHSEIVKLGKEKEELQQMITELEDEKGQWQLQEVEAEKVTVQKLSIEPTNESQLEEKCRVQTETIRLLEEQKYEYSVKLDGTQKELEELRKQLSVKDKEESDRVVSELSEIQLEEQIAEQTKSLTTLQTQLTEKEFKIEDLNNKLIYVLTEKETLDKKLEHYLSENMELLDKVEKLSKSSSSAESIEIVERLTQQERAEIEEFNKRLDQEHEEAHAREEKEIQKSISELQQATGNEMGQELSESLIKLREESSELMNKIELFTTERREVLEKMEHLTAENNDLLRKIEELKDEKEQLKTNAMLAENAKSHLELKMQDLNKEKELLATQVSESSAQKSKLSQELTSLQHSSEVVAALEGAEGSTLFDKCEKSLSKLNSELEAYRKANDKNAKINASKKLAKEAKNAYTQLSELLQKVKESSSAVETVTVVETVVAVTAPNGKALAEYEQLTAQNRQLKVTVEELRRELQEAREEHQGSTVNVTKMPAITEENEQEINKQKQIERELRLAEFEEQCTNLQSTVEDLRLQLQEARLASGEMSDENNRLNKELKSLQNMSEDFDRLINDKEMIHEKQIEQLTHLRRELEAKCDTYEGELEILQTLITEQKQQIIESYQESEHEINLKLLDLQQRDEEITQLHTELRNLKESTTSMGQQFAENLQTECEKLKEILKINKNLVAEQVNELSNKQETIDTLNQQIIDLYKTMEENTNKIIEKDDEITYLQELLESNTKQLDALQKDNDEQKKVVDKLLGEIHSHKSNAQQLTHLEAELQRLERLNNELEHNNKNLEHRNKEQLEKLKKYAANLKKRTTQCQEYEAKIQEYEKGVVETMQTKDTVANVELQELMANNVMLNEKITELETRLNKTEYETKEMKAALQAKIVEHLESIERNTQLEKELKELKEYSSEKSQQVLQLEIALEDAQNQVSDWGDVTENNLAADNLTRELEAKTISLEKSEQTLNDVQNELMQLQEIEKQRLIAEQEFQSELKEKTHLINELRQQLNEQANIKTLQQQLNEQTQRLQEVGEELKSKSLKFEKSKAVIKERNNQIHRLQAELRDLQAKLSTQPEEEVFVVKHQNPTQSQLSTEPYTSHIAKEEHESLKQSYEKLNEKYQLDKANFQETIAKLETLHDGIQAKLQEDMSYIETLELENAKYKDKICKLEECVATFEERRASMEIRANLLDAQMQSKTDEYEKSEDALVYRLNMLSEHDDVIGQRLLDSQEEKEELQERLQQRQSELNTLNSKYTKLEKEYESYKEETVNNLEAENATLCQKLVAIDMDMQRLRTSNAAKLTAKDTELDELESELNEQLGKMNAEKRALMEELERARDECTEQKDEIVRLKDTLNMLEQSKTELERESTWLRMQNESSQQDQYDLQELRMQSIQDKTENDNLRHQIETLASNHEIELQGLRTQISELDTLRMQVGQNQTDDQVFIETENKRLTDLLAEKEVQIENYQRQNLQLQVAAVAASTQSHQPAQPDPFALAFGLPPHSQSLVSDDRDRLERELAEKSEMANRLQRDYNALQAEFHSLLDGNNDMKRQLLDKQREIENIRRLHTSATHHPAPSDVIPAPMFFATEQLMPSPFDDIIPVRSIDAHTLEGAASSRNSIGIQEHQLGLEAEQPSIEDLQRNVSDLEKHAQDLENKLLIRNQRDGELEERLHEVQERLRISEHNVQQREEQIRRAELERKQTEEQHQLLQAQIQNEASTYITELQKKLDVSEQQVKAFDDKFNLLERETLAAKKVESAISDHTQKAAVERLTELQSNLENLQKLLQERDEQLTQLKCTLADASQDKVDKSIEDQIISSSFTQFDNKLNSAAPTLDMFFGSNLNAPAFDNLIMPQVSSEPVVEEVIVPKKAYLCHPGDAAVPTSLDLGVDWGDSWGGSDAVAEAAHFAVTSSAAPQHSLISREQQLEIQLQEQNDRIQELQLAQERCEQQKQELHVKLGKLMKKLKEYKTKIDELQATTSAAASFRKSCSVESNSMFSDLDAAIQEELKTQVKQLENKLEEQRKQQENQNVEKEKLLKRIDVLTAGNERMSEMKERQDMDVQMYQVRIRELQDKINSLEDWGGADNSETEKLVAIRSDKATHNQPDSSAQKYVTDVTAECQNSKQKIAELQAEIQDINDDRQELQALLDEEKSNVKLAEETSRQLQMQIAVLENAVIVDENVEKSKHNELKLEFQNINELCNNLKEEKLRLSKELQDVRDNADHKTNDLLQLQTELEVLSQKNKELLAQSHQHQLSGEVEARLLDLKAKNEQLEIALQASEQQIIELQMDLLELKTSNDELLQQNAELQSINSNIELEQQILRLAHEKQQLGEQLNSLRSELSLLQSKTKTTANMTSDSTLNTDELSAHLQEKESEIVHLKQRIEDLMREDQTEKLVLEILTKNQEIHMLKMQVKHLEDDKHELEHNLSLQLTKEMKNKVDSSSEQLQKLEGLVKELQEEKKLMEAELEVLNNHVINSLDLEDKMKSTVLELDTKNIEIAELRKSLETLQAASDKNNITEPTPEVNFVTLNAQWETHMEQKCGEIAQMWREHLEQREKDFKTRENKLQEEIAALRASASLSTTAATATVLPTQQQQQETSAETTGPSSSAAESTTASGSSSVVPSKEGTPLRRHRIINEESEAEADAIIEKMQAALESQEMEIVTLKEQLAIRSAEYARLAAQYDPFKLHTTLSHSGMNTISSPSSIDSPPPKRNASTGDNSVVPKSELDFALYMLHQRDMRCEEMTLELVSLLEERDTLQLKLSNTLRQVEAIKAQTNYVEPPYTKAETLTTSSSDSPSKSKVMGTTAGDSSNELNQKLSQLQTVNHSKYRGIKEEHDQRIRQMEKIHQDVAKMPSEAVSELVGSNMSQTNQSPSTTLLNWLWGNKPDTTDGSPTS